MASGSHPSLQLYGLLFLEPDGESHANLAQSAGSGAVIYVRNAVTLARSAAAAGQDFTLITNDGARIETILAQEGLKGALNLREFAFTLDVPPTLAFRSAHYKLDLVRAFGSGEFGAVPALVDIDAVLLRALELPDMNRVWAYDISAQEWGETPSSTARESLSALAGEPVGQPRWYGGEFLAGPAHAFAQLGEEIAAIWPAYLAAQGNRYHTGDEMVLSAALHRLASKAVPIGEAGEAQLVSRWWSRRTKSEISCLSSAEQAAVLHLPADKPYLASLAENPFDADAFRRGFRHYAAGRRRGEIVKVLAERALGRPSVVLPQLG